MSENPIDDLMDVLAKTIKEFGHQSIESKKQILELSNIAKEQQSDTRYLMEFAEGVNKRLLRIENRVASLERDVATLRTVVIQIDQDLG